MAGASNRASALRVPGLETPSRRCTPTSSTPARSRRRRRLANSEVRVLSEQLLVQMERLEAWMAEQHRIIKSRSHDAVDEEVQVLRGIERATAMYLQALDRVRSGRPTCRRCSALLTVKVLTVDPLAVECGGCMAARASSEEKEP